MTRIRSRLILAGHIRPASSAARPAANASVQVDSRACAARRHEAVLTPTDKALRVLRAAMNRGE